MEKKRKIIPPVYLFISLALMWLLQMYFPVHQFIGTPIAYAGIIPVFFGISMAAISAGMFVKADTGLEPFDEATTLVTGGFYRITLCYPWSYLYLLSAITLYWVKNGSWRQLLASTTWIINLK